MRIALALVALLSGSAVASAAETMCSGGFDRPAKMVFNDDNSMDLIVGKKREHFKFGGSVGTGLNGSVYVPQQGKSEVVFRTIISMDVNLTPPDEPAINIFRDRVFWPCK